MSPHHTDQMSQWSQVFRIALCITKVKVTELVTQWLSESQGHLLSCSGQLKIQKRKQERGKMGVFINMSKQGIVFFLQQFWDILVRGMRSLQVLFLREKNWFSLLIFHSKVFVRWNCGCSDVKVLLCHIQIVHLLLHTHSPQFQFKLTTVSQISDPNSHSMNFPHEPPSAFQGCLSSYSSCQLGNLPFLDAIASPST